jgi:secreted trypsin-like serine protease
VKKIFLICLILLFPLSGFAQKISIEIIKNQNIAVSEWQILDENYQLVFDGNDYSSDDSVFVPLEANRHYFLQVSFSSVIKPGAVLYSLLIDNSPVIVIKSDTVSGDYFYPFFTGTRTVQAKIVGGVNASISDFPWQIFLISGNYQCGGSIISPHWVATAEHCTFNGAGNPTPADSIVVFAGATDPYTSGTPYYYVDKVIQNTNYDKTTYANDIALLHVSDSIACQYCKPIKIISAEDVAEGAADPGIMVWVTGWGLTNPNSEFTPSILQKAQMPIVSNTAAAVIWGPIPASDIMAGYVNGTKDACSGDSGGPMSDLISGEYKLSGLVSWGSTTCSTYGAYTRVSMFESWIKDNTGITYFTPSVPSGDTLVCDGTDTSNYSINVVTGAGDYNWMLVPGEAGTITWDSTNAQVVWNQAYTGTVKIKARVTLNDTYSDWSILTVTRALITKILSQPRDTITCESDSITLNLQTTGSSLIYNWYKNGSAWPGTTNKISFKNLSTSNSGKYSCQVTGLCGSLSTNEINLTVYPLTRISSITPDITTEYGSDITLSVDATGHDLSYRWKQNGTDVGEDSSSLSMQNVNATNIGRYWSVVTGSCGTKVSDSTYVYLKKEASAVAPVITVWPTLTSDVVNIASSTSDSYAIRIISLTGNIMSDMPDCHYQTTINVSRYPRGIYFINVMNGNLNKSVRIVKD